jgi:hypothetical protein
MSQNLGSININDLELIQTDTDPTQGIGLDSEVGSICFLNVAGKPFYQKFDTGNTDWKPMIGSSFAQYNNTQINQNLNGSTSSAFDTQVQILGSEQNLDPDFEKSGENIRAKFDGFVIAITNCHLYSTDSRTGVQMRFKKNGTLVGPVSSCGYIGNNSGHNESSLHIYTIIPVVNNDLIGLYSRREASDGDTYLDSVGTSNLILMRY